MAVSVAIREQTIPELLAEIQQAHLWCFRKGRGVYFLELVEECQRAQVSAEHGDFEPARVFANKCLAAYILLDCDNNMIGKMATVWSRLSNHSFARAV